MDGNLILKIFGLFMLGCMCLGLGEFTCELLNLWGLIPATLVLIGFNYLIYRAIADENLKRTLTITIIPMILTYAVGAPMGLAAYKEKRYKNDYYTNTPDSNNNRINEEALDNKFLNELLNDIDKLDPRNDEIIMEEYRKYEELLEFISGIDLINISNEKEHDSILNYLVAICQINFDVFRWHEDELDINYLDIKIAKELREDKYFKIFKKGYRPELSALLSSNFYNYNGIFDKVRKRLNIYHDPLLY